MSQCLWAWDRQLSQSGGGGERWMWIIHCTSRCGSVVVLSIASQAVFQAFTHSQAKLSIPTKIPWMNSPFYSYRWKWGWNWPCFDTTLPALYVILCITSCCCYANLYFLNTIYIKKGKRLAWNSSDCSELFSPLNHVWINRPLMPSSDVTHYPKTG